MRSWEFVNNDSATCAECAQSGVPLVAFTKRSGSRWWLCATCFDQERNARVGRDGPTTSPGYDYLDDHAYCDIHTTDGDPRWEGEVIYVDLGNHRKWYCAEHGIKAWEALVNDKKKKSITNFDFPKKEGPWYCEIGAHEVPQIIMTESFGDGRRSYCPACFDAKVASLLNGSVATVDATPIASEPEIEITDSTVTIDGITFDF